MIAAHGLKNEIAVIDNELGPSFDKNAEGMGVKGDEGEDPMDKNQDHAAPEGGEESSASVDRPRQDGREDNHEDSVKPCFARERPFMSESDHDQCREKNDQTSQRNLEKSELLGFDTETENWRTEIVDRIHIQKFYRPKKSWRVYRTPKMNPLGRRHAFY